MVEEHTDEYWMGLCLKLAETAAHQGEVPVGAVVVLGNTLIGQGYNLRESTGDPTAHAEIVALRDAARHLGHWRILDATLYVTLEPCTMCAGALVNARIRRLVYGCADAKSGAVESLYEIPTDVRLNHRLEVRSGCRSDECVALLKAFFRDRRKETKARKG
ncbi:MAG: tRNA adenosine(34) deaminase TadA [Myxococcota bacterium]|nr:tRNA adenosine(34) deaminase TadA [Myxococcota bacterium]